MISKMLNILSDTSVPKRVYLLKAFLIEIIPSLILFSFFIIIAPEALEQPILNFEKSIAQIFLSLVIIYPLIETLFLGLLLWALSVFTGNVFVLSLSSGLSLGILLGMFKPGSGILTFWPIVVYSICFLEWKKKSVKDAIIVTSLLYSLHNLIPVICFAVLKLMNTVNLN